LLLSPIWLRCVQVCITTMGLVRKSRTCDIYMADVLSSLAMLHKQYTLATLFINADLLKNLYVNQRPGSVRVMGIGMC
jgi:hypothetical protein